MGESRLGLLIASPPCPTFSSAGKGAGRRLAVLIAGCMTDLLGGRDTRAEHVLEAEMLLASAADEINPDEQMRRDAAMSMLVVEPLRYAIELRPTYIALEQVPPVLGLWEVMATKLRALGYRTWTGELSAERYGIPQTRKRAILLASLAGQPAPPRPTHQRYVPGEPARHEVTLDGEILPWVSMAEALSWPSGERGLDRRQGNTQADGSRRMVPVRPDSEPAPTVDGTGMAKHRNVWRIGFPRNADNGEATPEGHRARDFRDEDEPALTVTEKARSAVKMRANAQDNAAVRDAHEPAPTIKGGNDSGDRVWMQMGDRVQPGGGNVPRPADSPSATLGTRTDLAEWVEERPATTVNGDPHIARPGHKGDKKKEPDAISQMDNAVRVSVAEASILQSFPPDYPWRGSRTAQFRQIGNAVPPLLARAILESLTGGGIGDDALDLFAGPGGWDVGAEALGIRPLGVELDPTACETREAAGLRTLCGDVAQLDPAVSEGQQDGRSPMIWALPDPRFTKEAKDERS